MEFDNAPMVDDLRKAIIWRKRNANDQCSWLERDITIYTSSAAGEVPLDSKTLLSTDDDGVGREARSPYYYKGWCLFIRYSTYNQPIFISINSKYIYSYPL